MKKLLFAAGVVLMMSTSVFAQDKERRQPPPPEKVVAHLDTDKDGKISKAEADKAERGRLKEHFDDVDGNADGYVTTEELKAAMDRRRENGGKRKK